MFKVIVKKASDLSHIGWRTFDTAEIANAWLDEVSPSGAWGKPAYTEIIPAVTEMQEIIIQEEILDDDGNVTQEAITEMQLVEIEPEQVIEHAAEFTVEIVDISAEIAAEQKLQQRKIKRAFGENMIDQISLINESANVNAQALEALILDADFMVVREHLWSGSLKSAYDKILTIEAKILTVFSQASLDNIKAQLVSKLQELNEI
jgi:hypothetical protein